MVATARSKQRGIWSLKRGSPMDKIEFGKKLIAGLRSMNAFEICNALEKLVRKPRGYGCTTKNLIFTRP